MTFFSWFSWTCRFITLKVFKACSRGGRNFWVQQGFKHFLAKILKSADCVAEVEHGAFQICFLLPCCSLIKLQESVVCYQTTECRFCNQLQLRVCPNNLLRLNKGSWCQTTLNPRRVASHSHSCQEHDKNDTHPRDWLQHTLVAKEPGAQVPRKLVPTVINRGRQRIFGSPKSLRSSSSISVNTDEVVNNSAACYNHPHLIDLAYYPLWRL